MIPPRHSQGSLASSAVPSWALSMTSPRAQAASITGPAAAQVARNEQRLPRYSRLWYPFVQRRIRFIL